ncbi:MAG: hypothetical protein WC763_06160 [Candidatus Paceibacterota bacterium]|jgi:hypothetical protein
MDDAQRRVVVFGGRDLWLSVFALDHWLEIFGLLPNAFEMVEGEAAGVDISAKRWAEHYGMEPRKFFASWKAYGKAAGPIRNGVMADYADWGIGFITDGSRGTADMDRQMKHRKKVVHMVRYDFIPDGWDNTEETL